MTGRRVVLTVLGGVVVAVCVALGLWQLQRLSDRRALNDRLIAREALPVAEVATLTPLDGGRGDPAAYRRVRTTGVYDPANEVVLRARSLNGRAGNHLLTPLTLAGGDAIIVDRGWIPLTIDRPGAAQTAPPAGEVTVTGILVPTEPKPIVFGPRDPPAGRLTTIGRIDLERLAQQMPYAIEPLAIAMEQQRPAQTDLPHPAGRPPPGEGPHLAYAVQWFIFAAIALITTTLLMRRERAAGSARVESERG